MTNCVLCTEKISEDDLVDRTGMAHLECSIEICGGCEDCYGMFLSCATCWNSCQYRQELPDDAVLNTDNPINISTRSKLDEVAGFISALKQFGVNNVLAR